MRSRTHRIGLAALVFTLVSIAGAALAEPPPDVAFQGQLLDAAGLPLAGPVDLELLVFDQPIDGAPLYAEDHAGLALDEGAFTVLIGTGSNPLGSFDATLFSGMSRWLEVVVDGEVLAPRQPLSSVPYALHTQEAVFAATAGDAQTLGGVGTAALDQSAHLAAAGNPHGVTAAEIGAASASEIDAALAGHTSDAAAHHAKTESFTELTDQASDAQIPDTITRDAELAGGVDALQAQISALQAENAALGTQLAAVEAESATLTTLVAGLETANAGLGTSVASLQSTVDELAARFAGVSRSGDLLRFDAMNVQFTNGSGSTASANGLGNVIVGYGEQGAGSPDRSGSHNLVLGTENSYSSHAGFVGGTGNAISAPFASVLTGRFNEASAQGASVTAGSFNEASAPHASVSGGEQNTASGEGSSVSGGDTNTASSFRSSASGGQGNEASGGVSSVTGGVRNVASGPGASVTGGVDNVAAGSTASVSGGRNGQALGEASAIAGGGGADPDDGNTAHAPFSAVLGGRSNVAGDAGDTTLGEASSVSGGENNRALGRASSIAGGGGNSVLDANVTYGPHAAILGGARNRIGFEGDPLTPNAATVSGGRRNNARGSFSSVSGGGDRFVSSDLGWRAGSLFESN